MANSLFFVLAPATGLPQGPLSWADLADAQALGLGQLLALRIFACPPGWPGSLETLVEDGLAHSGGDDPFGAGPPRQPGAPSSAQPQERRLAALLTGYWYQEEAEATHFVFLLRSLQ